MIRTFAPAPLSDLKHSSRPDVGFSEVSLSSTGDRSGKSISLGDNDGVDARANVMERWRVSFRI